ncbi:hypothetical protein E3N88_10012 [Mikania micrantha]|uniref:Uncharacterized protein n=1 Tax=Mikania micrantha TaxID=192012 RepID=A0A5N6P996_9ASTR|nr:hypothetical protein E3N88_10012 [Mikania micrantha]
MEAAQDRQKSYADKRRRPIESRMIVREKWCTWAKTVRETELRIVGNRETKNLDFYHPRGTPHLTVWRGAMRLTSASRINGLKSQFGLEEAILILPFDDSSHHTRKISLQSIKPSILKTFDQVDRTRERFCKSGSSFYAQNSVWLGNGSF